MQYLRTVFALVALAITPAATCIADEVVYQLSYHSLENPASTETVEPFSIVFQERAWVVAGVEQTDHFLPQIKEVDFTPQHSTGFPWEAPHWIDDLAWPRTRAMFRGAEDEIQMFSFLIALQR